MTQDNSIDTVEVKKYYFASGALWIEDPYVNGKIHGIDKWYYESGALERETLYKKGKRHGIVKVYYKSGALRWEIPFVNGKMHGIERGYDNDNINIDCLVLYNGDQEVTSIKI